MVELVRKGVFLFKSRMIVEAADQLSEYEINNRLLSADLGPLSDCSISQETARANTMAYQIMTAHNLSGDWRKLKLRFDSLASHDITYVGIIQTAAASGLKEFPVPYVLTNCHNSLCAVGGTINEDDHVYGVSAARKYGGIFVPAHQAVIHQYMREMMSGCGKMILGSDSHTRYGALGTMAIGEGGPELAKQLLNKTYDMDYPEVVAVYLDGHPIPGVGPQDVALAIIGAVFKDGFVKNKVLEFVGPGVGNLSVDFRNGIDVMTTETTCLSSIWCTDEKVLEFYRIHGRPDAYRKLEPGEVSYYDGLIKVDLGRIVPMIALPFHPSNVWSISELNQHAVEILREIEMIGKKQLENPNVELRLSNKVVNGRVKVDQGIVAGCAGGTFENIAAMAQILEGKSTGTDQFALSIYPASQPVNVELINNRAIEKLMIAGAVLRSAFCGPCFGAGDVPANNGLSIRHTTRNFPNREGSRPGDGQIASVALMDARSIAATALNGGILTPATEIDFPAEIPSYQFNKQIYDNRVYQGFGKAQPKEELTFGPNIVAWPKIRALPQNLLLKVASVIHDPVTTTDELIPSGEASSYRSNPLKLAEFTLSRKDPGYVNRAKAVQALELKRQTLSNGVVIQEVEEFFRPVLKDEKQDVNQLQQIIRDTGIGSVIFAIKPGDGSAREQAASCQRVLGGDANIAIEYAAKRYRSNLINWGMIPFTISTGDQDKLRVDDYLYIPGIRQAIINGEEKVQAVVVGAKGTTMLELKLEDISQEERDIILAGCLMNYYAN
ncbi:hydratase [Sporomusa malonica]|uniref:Aconitate hydratase n=1 Tax=Sporomusa malonica TaxID=112901 RepID=A0A1W1Y671_9FIRM|nr:hydratase [Sporomusa malonica]SMC31647.1 aconitate hydratase [Sporomusa malonica]